MGVAPRAAVYAHVRAGGGEGVALALALALAFTRTGGCGAGVIVVGGIVGGSARGGEVKRVGLKERVVHNFHSDLCVCVSMSECE